MFLSTDALEVLGYIASMIQSVFSSMANIKIPFGGHNVSIFTIVITVVLFNLFIIVFRTIIGGSSSIRNSKQKAPQANNPKNGG